MAEHDIIQKMIFQLGQSQDQRLAKELAGHFADVDERTPETQLLFTKKFAEFVKYYRNTISAPAGNWKKFFDYDETAVRQLLEGKEAKTSPHLALFLAFLELYKTPQEVINRITGRHLGFYYEDVLRLQKKSAVPDKAHVIVELKKNAPPISIVPHKDLFSAGKDKTGVELLYDPTSQTIINTSKVDSLRSLFWDKSGHGTVKYAPVANSSDGIGGKLLEAEPKWHAFGQAGLPPAEVGFAIASPVLRMQEGIRKVTVTLTLNNVDASRLNDAALAGAFDVFITGEKNWFGPYNISPKLSAANVLQFDFQILETEKAVVDYSAAIHGYSYTAAAPVLQVLLKAGSANIGYNDFGNVVLQKAAVAVDVSNVTSLKLESDGGALDPKKAFLPFGPQPAAGSRFLVGYDEALSKKLAEVNIKVQWKDAPANFQSYYSDYAVRVNNDYFTASVAFKDGGSWQFSGTGQKLFQHSNASSEMNFTFTPGSSSVSPGMTEGRKVFALSSAGNLWSSQAVSQYVLARPVFLSFQRSVPEAVKGFITLALEKNFLHSTYRKKYVENVMTYSRDGGTLTILNEPYTPAIQSISLSYKAHSDEVNIASTSLDDFSNSDVQFFHIAYFGQMREHGHQRAQFDFLANKSVSLLPAYPHEGELLIGCHHLQAGDSVSVLFQVAEGSADTDLTQEEIRWFVLCDNYWKKLGSSEVVLDTTNQLLASGLIKFVVPLDATTTNTILPSGRVWLKAAVTQNVAAVCQFLQVATNAVEVQFMDQGNGLQHLQTSLEMGKISKLKSGLSAVKAVTQPYASFGGNPVETDAPFHTRASERLRHKNRCITPWDYERIVLEAFPKVHKVKCIPHADENSWLAPGHVLLVVVPDLKNKNAINLLQPKVDANTISQITAHAQARAGMLVKLKVKNPRYQKVQLDFAVKFRTGYEFNFYSEALKQEIIRFLSPWAYQADRDIAFGGKIYKSVLLDFVEDIAYVDFVTDFKLYSFTDAAGQTLSDVHEIQPETPDTILVSSQTHIVKEVV